MKHYQKLICLALLLLSKCYGAPLEIETTNWEEDPELTGGYIEGDMIVDLNRNGLISESRRWPNKTVLYKMSSDIEDEYAEQILKAMDAISNVSCIEFKDAGKKEKGFVNITVGGSSCYSMVGYANTVRKYNLRKDDINTGCFRVGTIIHELLHTLGFEHQQSSPDRDDYVDVLTENIMDGKESNFSKMSNNTITDFGVGYDYGSVMHYSAYAFSKNGKKTIIPKEDEKIEIGQRRGMSDKDIKKLNLMYKCDQEDEH